MATVTAAQKRAQAKTEYDAFLAACPSRKLLDRLSDKWVTLILAGLGSDGSHQLGTGCAGEPRSMRYSELARLLAGVSQEMQVLGRDAHGRCARQPRHLRHPHRACR
jgi:DNA-binding HxlR family transcriptional regulator